MTPHPLLLTLERRIALGPTYAARLMGLAYVTYAQYRSGRRDLQLYHQRHIEALLALSEVGLAELVKEHIHGDKQDTL